MAGRSFVVIVRSVKDRQLLALNELLCNLHWNSSQRELLGVTKGLNKQFCNQPLPTNSMRPTESRLSGLSLTWYRNRNALVLRGG